MCKGQQCEASCMKYKTSVCALQAAADTQMHLNSMATIYTFFVCTSHVDEEKWMWLSLFVFFFISNANQVLYVI